MVVIALVILLIALAGRWSPQATKLSAALFGLMIVQFFLGIIGSGTAPVVGGLHAANALLVTGVAFLLVREARQNPEAAATV